MQVKMMSAIKSKIKRFLSVIMASLMILPFGVSVLSACGNADSGKTPVVDPEKPDDKPQKPDKPDDPPKNDQDRYVTFENVRVGLISDTVVRVELKGNKGFEDRDTFYISNRDAAEVPKYTVSVENGVSVVATADYKVFVPNGARSLNSVRIEDANGAELWRYEGETTSNVYLPSPSDELAAWQFSDNPRIIPSDYGYSYIENNLDSYQGWDFGNDAPDCYVFLPKGDYKQFCEDYIQLTGKSELISLQMLGFWDSRWYAYTDKTAMQQIDDYIDRGYSIDVLVIDKDWHANAGSDGVGYEVDTDLFPNMAQFLEDCHDRGINIAFNDHPEPVRGTGSLLDGAEVQYRNESLTMILSLGLDYWWYDRNWHVALKPVHPDISVFATGMYAFQFVTDEYLHTEIDDLNEYAERALIMGNVDGCLHGRWKYASDASAHKYTIQWTGDISTDKTALEQEIYASIFGGAEVGIPYMSSDIGGHTSAVTDDMYTRWIQYGALSTIFRVHCTAVENIGQDGRMPWLFGDTAEKVMHEYMDMRYRLLPLFYSLSRENYDTGLPIMRRTDIEYPQYAEASRNDQYLLGTNVLVAPINEGIINNPVPTEWLTSLTGEPGLTASYYTGTGLGGTPRRVQIDKTIDFDWGNGGPSGLGSDNFSIKWEGTITVGENDCKLKAYADDGIRVYIDGQKVIDGWAVYDKMLETNDYLAAGSTHSIRVEYFEAGGGAHVYLYYADRSSESIPNTRTVFIPDGTWIDVWSGERYVGPQTITVSHGLETSPIFVREGGVLALAENMVNTSEKDWSNMALDIYAGTQSTQTMLYEDDVKTQAYKDGQYRKTLITNEYADGKFTVTVNPAEGEFKGDRAFTEREWTVRIHYRPEWGSLKAVRVNGSNAKNYRAYNKSTNASPFAFSGASRDSSVFEFKITAGVYEKTVITFEFTGTVTEPEKPDYDDNPTEFTVTTDEVGSALNLTDEAIADWAYFGADDSKATARKAVSKHYIGEVGTYAAPDVLDFTGMYTSWTDGEGEFARSAAVTTGLSSEKNFDLTLKTDTTKRYYVIYLGGTNCIAKLTVRDRAGNVKTIKLGDLYGSFDCRVIIEAKSEVETELALTYAVLVSRPNGTGTFSRVYISAAYAASKVLDNDDATTANVECAIAVKNNPASADLSQAPAGYKVVDWRCFDETIDNNGYVAMAGGNTLSKVLFTASQNFDDYTTKFTWTDGTAAAPALGTTHGLCSPSGTITLILAVTPATKKVLLYTGAWNATNTVTVLDGGNNVLAIATPFTGGSSAATRLVEIDVDAEAEAMIIIRIESSGVHDMGNVSIAGVQILEAE